jgi:hypothetical protein
MQQNLDMYCAKCRGFNCYIGSKVAARTQIFLFPHGGNICDNPINVRAGRRVEFRQHCDRSAQLFGAELVIARRASAQDAEQNCEYLLD